jgi:hypothetical protein
MNCPEVEHKEVGIDKGDDPLPEQLKPDNISSPIKRRNTKPDIRNLKYRKR